MVTIDQLMEGKKPGEIKITYPGMGDKSYFIPFFIDQHGFWNGLNEKGHHQCFGCEAENWEIYTDPKQKKILHEVMYRSKKSSPDCKAEWHISARLVDEERFVSLSDEIYEYRKTGRTFEVDDD